MNLRALRLSGRRTRELLLGGQLVLLAWMAWAQVMEILRLLVEVLTYDLLPVYCLAAMVGAAGISVARHGGWSALARAERRAAVLGGILSDGLAVALCCSALLIVGMSPFAFYDEWLSTMQADEIQLRTWLDGFRGGVMAAGLALLLRPWITRGWGRLGLVPIMLSAALALEPVSSYALGADLVLGLGVCLLSMAAAIWPRVPLANTQAWLLEDAPEQVRLRLPGLHSQRFYDLFGSLLGLVAVVGIGINLVGTQAGLSLSMTEGALGELRRALGMALVWLGVLGGISGLLRFVCARWRAVAVTLTPTAARVGSQRVDARALSLELVSDGEGTMLVVGDGVVLSAPVDPTALGVVLARVRDGVVQESETDRQVAREALKDVAPARARASQRWLEVGRRRYALANLIVPGVLTVMFLGMQWDGASYTDYALVITVSVVFLVGLARVARMALASRRAMGGVEVPAGEQSASAVESTVETPTERRARPTRQGSET